MDDDDWRNAYENYDFDFEDEEGSVGSETEGA